MSLVTRESVACDETLRKWRREGSNVFMLDLRRAYLQLHVEPTLWKHQIVSFRGRHYYLTRLGFGLVSAPKIMSVILEKVLSLDADVNSGTSHYIDDIMVNEHSVSKEFWFGNETVRAASGCQGARPSGVSVT